MTKLLLEDIMNEDELVQKKVEAEVREAIKILYHVDAYTSAEQGIKYYERQIGNKPIFGTQEDWDQKLKDKAKEARQKIESLNKEGLPETRLNCLENNSSVIYHGLIDAVRSGRLAYHTKIPAGCFGGRANFGLDCRDNNSFRLYVDGNPHMGELTDIASGKVKEAWESAEFAVL